VRKAYRSLCSLTLPKSSKMTPIQKHPAIAVLGGGSWATALIKVLCENNDVVGWWVRNSDDVEHIQKHQHNPRYLSDVTLDTDKLFVSTDLHAVAGDADVLILAVPAAFLADALEPLQGTLHSKRIISAVKGIIPETHQVVGEWLRDMHGVPFLQFGAIIGASHAEEVAMERLSYLSVASRDRALARAMSKNLKTDYMQVKHIRDIIGSEYASVIKNIYAIAAGIAHGLGYGDNFQAALVSNAQREMRRFIKAVHGKRQDIIRTEYSSDLFVTMYSPFSRNRTLGHMIGKGYSLQAAMNELGMVAEGYYAAKHIRDVKRQAEVKMPIASAVYKVLYKDVSPKKAIRNLVKKLD